MLVCLLHLVKCPVSKETLRLGLINLRLLKSSWLMFYSMSLNDRVAVTSPKTSCSLTSTCCKWQEHPLPLASHMRTRSSVVQFSQAIFNYSKSFGQNFWRQPALLFYFFNYFFSISIFLSIWFSLFFFSNKGFLGLISAFHISLNIIIFSLSFFVLINYILATLFPFSLCILTPFITARI